MKKSIAFLMIISGCLLSCSDDDGPKLIEFETLAISDQSPVSPGRGEYVINNSAQYEALFGTTIDVDFDRETVVAVFLGVTGNSGNSYEITELQDDVSHITATITYRVPRVPSGPNSNHYHVIKTRKLDRPFVFSTFEIRE